MIPKIEINSIIPAKINNRNLIGNKNHNSRTNQNSQFDMK